MARVICQTWWYVLGIQNWGKTQFLFWRKSGYFIKFIHGFSYIWHFAQFTKFEQVIFLSFGKSLETHLKFPKFQIMLNNSTTIRNQTKEISKNLSPIKQPPHKWQEISFYLLFKRTPAKVIPGLVTMLSPTCSGDRREREIRAWRLLGLEEALQSPTPLLYRGENGQLKVE